MTSTMYIPLVNVSDAANIEHSTFGRFMAKRTCFVMVKMCLPVRENWAKFAFARVAADTGERHNTKRALNGHHGHPLCGKGVVFSCRDLYFIFLEFLKPYPPFQPIEKGLFLDKIVVLDTHVRILIQKFP